MTAQELKEKLKEEDIRKLLIEMGATFYYEDDDMWITDTICHHGTKPKLYYYKDSMSFLFLVIASTITFIISPFIERRLSAI